MFRTYVSNVVAPFSVLPHPIAISCWPWFLTRAYRSKPLGITKNVISEGGKVVWSRRWYCWIERCWIPVGCRAIVAPLHWMVWSQYKFWLAFRPTDSPSCEQPGPLLNAVLGPTYRAKWHLIPSNDECDRQTDRPRYSNICRNSRHRCKVTISVYYFRRHMRTSYTVKGARTCAMNKLKLEWRAEPNVRPPGAGGGGEAM